MEAGIQSQKKSDYYALAQLAGWGLHFMVLLVLLLPGRSAESLSWLDLFPVASLCITGFILTHCFRALVLHFEWIRFALPKLILLALLLNLMMAFLGTAINWQITSRIIQGLSFVDLALLFLHNLSLFIFWSGIYFGINFLRRYRKEEIRRLKWEGSLKEFELNKLKSQLNPHFVFNALNGIRSLIGENPEKSREAINQLSGILRSSLLSDRAETILLSEEILTVMDYLNLEKIRLEDRLDFELRVDEACFHIMVPPMMIQTLVENAVKHGISRMVKGGKITVSGALSGGEVHLSIANNGKLSSESSEGFGIPNTRQRLDLIYGKKASFNIFQASPDTVMARLIFPAKHK